MIKFTAPSRPYKGYIFDCDGTLADSMPLHLEAWRKGLAAAGAPFELDGEAFMSVAGMALRQTIDHWNESHSIQIDADTVMRVKNEHFESHRHTIKPIQPVVDFARSCKASGAAISVASGGIREDVLDTLEKIGMAGFFPVITTADDVEQSKPAPDLFILAAEKMGLAHSDCLVIEDSQLGVEAADACGMDSVLVPHPF